MSNSVKVSLPAEITIYTLGSLRAEWQEWVARATRSRRRTDGAGKPWLVDAARVDEVDAAGVQLLLSLAKSMSASNRPLQLVNASQTLGNACKTLGATSLLQDSSGVSS